jgi:hypothetical protein
MAVMNKILIIVIASATIKIDIDMIYIDFHFLKTTSPQSDISILIIEVLS